MFNPVAVIRSIGILNFILRMVVVLCALFMLAIIVMCGSFLLWNV